jgi:1,4-alpha-glucan branching enzyme
MKICFVSFEYPPRILGGAGTYASVLVKGLARIGVDVFVLAGGNRNTFEEKIYRLQISDQPYLRQYLFMHLASRKLRSLDKEFDLIHFNEPHILGRSPLELPIVSTLHSSQLNEINMMLKFASFTLTTTKGVLDLAVRSPVGYLGDLLTGHNSDSIISPSKNLANLLATQCFIDRNKIHFIPNAVDLEEFDNARTEDTLLKKHGLVEEEYILFMGRLSPMKGLQNLVEAFRWVKNKKKLRQARNLKLVIAGTGAYEKTLRKQAGDLKDVIFTGFVATTEGRKTLYSNSLAVALPSLYEAFPMVALEAMAMRKPVIATRVGDIPMIVPEKVSGLLAAPGDVKGLAGNMETLCEDYSLRKQMGHQGRSIVEANYTVDILAQKTFNAYRELIG